MWLKPHVIKALLLYNYYKRIMYNPDHEGLFRLTEAGVVLLFLHKGRMVFMRAFNCPECHSRISWNWLIIGDSKKIYECGICHKKYRYNDNMIKYYTVIFIAAFFIASISLGLFRKDYLHLKPLSVIQNIELFLIYMIVFFVIFCIFRILSFIISPDQYKIIEDHVVKIPACIASSTVQTRKKRPRKK